MQNNLTKNDIKIVVPLKYLSNFWRSLNIPLINCEIELILIWFKTCVLISNATRQTNYGADRIVRQIDNPENAIFQITDTKLYVAVVTLSKENDTKLLEKLKIGFKRTMKWNKYRLQMTVQPQNSNLDYLIDPAFTNVNRVFAFSFTRTNAGDDRDSFSDYYEPNIEIKDFNILIDEKSCFELPVKNEEEAYDEKIIDMSNNDDYTTGNLLDLAYFKENCKLIAIDLSKQTKLNDPQQNSFIGKFLATHGATMFFITEKSEETTLNFLKNYVTIK